jgi:hypothetical protein
MKQVILSTLMRWCITDKNIKKSNDSITMERQDYIHHMLKRDKKLVRAIQKQEEWRQKQIDIYYRIGRPIYRVDKKSIS